MMPLCTTATLSREPIGCALRSLGAPCVAQRVCVLPVVDVSARPAFRRVEAGFRVARRPAREPPVLAVVSGDGCTRRLERCDRGAAMSLHLVGAAPLPAAPREGPGGLLVRFEHPA